MGSVSMLDTSTPMDVSAFLSTQAVLPMSDPISLATDIVHSVVDYALSQVSTLVSWIAPSFYSFSKLNLNYLMTGVLFLLKPEW